MRLPWRVAALVCVLSAALVPAAPAHASPEGVESRVLQLINQGRTSTGKRAEVMHAGLRAMARSHSSYQSSMGAMSHDGLSGRIFGAAPDPYESNGAPDDGFSDYCENVAYYFPGSAGATEEQVAQKFYDVWYRSAPHNRCMFDSYGYGLNVAGVGIVHDTRGYWWATFDSVRDGTPPGSSPPAPGATWRRAEETTSAVTRAGRWYSYSDSRASGGTYLRSSTEGSYVRYTFSGTGVRWIGEGSRTAGKARVVLDGVNVATVDQYARYATFQRVMFQRMGLARGAHRLEIRALRSRNSSSSGYRTSVDAFERLP